ncbi:MAG: ribosome assembly RNA-binding protein YhbY [Erysipelotrichaceae bacterium]|nr:ribosome assembly RNA-binding protein YhbY [Erysipelotrichaceae bacterium]
MLTNKQKSYLRSLANPLRAIVLIGKDGLSETVIESLDVSLEAHELVKVSLLKSCPMEVKEASIELAVATKSEIVQTIGRTIVLYRRSKEPYIELPR